MQNFLSNYFTGLPARSSLRASKSKIGVENPIGFRLFKD
jgi:hypothetical protein